MAGVVVEIPYKPRPLQRAIHQALDGHRFAVAVCHRRFGKTVLAINQLIKAALLCGKPRPRFAYISPTYTQGKRIAWDYLKHYSQPIPEHGVHESELRVDYQNEGQVRIYGADNPDALRGIYLDGVVLDEFGLMPPTVFAEVIRPLLADRQGWAFFIGTPNGKNQFYDLIYGDQKEWMGAKNQPEWFYAEYKASETGLLSPSELADARAVMTADQYAQEFECSFEASVKGAVYAREMQAARESGRLTRVPYDPAMKVDTDWDLGMGDATAIWFSQRLYTGEMRLIDYYENSGYGLDHYRQVLNQKPYSYGDHWAPFDIQVRELGSGNSRLDTARQMGLHFQVSPKVESVDDRIHATRMLLPRCWFDAEKCERGIECLKNYAWDFNTRINEFTKLPVHNWASHGADAFGGLAFRDYQKRRSPEREAALAVARSQRDSDPFHWRKPTSLGRGGYA